VVSWKLKFDGPLRGAQMTALPACLLVFSATAGAPTQDPDVEVRIRGAVEKHFVFATAAERAVYISRLSEQFARLPRLEDLRNRALQNLEFWIASGPQRVGFTDLFRTMSQKHPELQPLVLPDQYYQRAYAMAVDAVESDFARAQSRAFIQPEVRESVARQIDRMGADAEAMIARQLGGTDAGPLAVAQVNAIIKEFRAAQANPFYAFDRPLSDDEYGRVVAGFREELRKLPLIKLSPPGAVSGDSKEAFRKELGLSGDSDEETGQAVTDVARAKALVREASYALYDYTRLNDPARFAHEDRFKELGAEAKSWMKDSKTKHLHLYHAILQRDVDPPKPSETTPPDANPLPRQPGAAPGPAVEKASGVRETSPSAPLREESGSGRRLSSVAILVGLGLVAFLICIGARKGSGKPADG
jgi:hypothetical protein